MLSSVMSNRPGWRLVGGAPPSPGLATPALTPGGSDCQYA